MDARALRDAHEAVGGMWDEMGVFQLDLLREHGLQPHHSVIDIGAGSLRGGRRIIGYLDDGNYCGTDLSGRLLDHGRTLLAEEGLLEKRPTLVQVEDFSFEALGNRRFDYLLAFGVFTDLPADSVVDCLRNVSRLMNPSSRLLATFGLADQYVPDPVRIRFRYPWPFFVDAARDAGLQVQLVPNIGHPKGHSLLIATLGASRSPNNHLTAGEGVMPRQAANETTPSLPEGGE